ncbi:MAG: hypothetical protein R6U21_03845 [Thermoplasmatota archaeon]
MKLKNQSLRINAYILLVMGIVILVQAVLFIFEIKGQLMVPLHLFSVQSQMYPAQFFQLLNFVAWLALILFVCMVGIIFIRKAISLLTLHQDTMFAKTVDLDEIKQICKSYEQFYD